MSKSTFKFTDWKPNTSKVAKTKLPVDVCAPLSASDRFINIEDRCSDILERRKDFINKRFKETAEANKHNKTDTKDMPKIVYVPLGECMFVVDVQRPLDENHVIDIIVNWDSRNWRTPKGSYDPVLKRYGITDGQHRVIAFRDRIRLGLFPDIKSEDWRSVLIPLEVTDLEVKDNVVDYSPAREQFLGENGGYTKKVSEMDKFMNEVAGKLIDSPTVETKPEYERAARYYTAMKKKGVTPVHSTDEGNSSKPGAFTAVRYLRGKKPITFKQLETLIDHHYDYARHEPIADIEVLPIIKLRDEIEEYGWYDDKDTAKVKETEKLFRYINAVVHEFGDWGNFQSIAEQVWNERCKKRHVKESVPADLSMALLLQLVQKAGYTFSGFDQGWYKKYEFGNNMSLFSCLNKDDQVKFK